jgi:hypothetical protein
MVEYQPSLIEWKITAGIWAVGLMIYTLSLKVAMNVFPPAGAQKPLGPPAASWPRSPVSVADGR